MTASEILETMGRMAPVAVVCRDNGSWHVRWSEVEVKEGRILRPATGDGMSYAEAVRDCWSAINALPPGRCLVPKAESPTERREFRWRHDRWMDEPTRKRTA